MNKQLTQYLLSSQNIQDLIDKLDCTIYIKPDSLQACRQIIHKTLSGYLTRLSQIPQTERQLISTISFLNKKCFDEILAFIESNYPNKNIRKDHEEVILTREEFEQLLATSVTHDSILKALTEPSVLMYLKSIIDTSEPEVEEDDYEIIDIHQFQSLLTKPQINLKNITPDNVMYVKERIEQLSTMDQTDQVKQEKASLIEALTSKSAIEEDGKYHIKVQIKPRSIDDLKSITFKPNIERKVKRIVLCSYYIPKNDNNVTRFTNTITIHKDKIYKHTIPLGHYTTDNIINQITQLVPFLNFKQDDTITVSSDSKFDIIMNNSIFSILGFTDTGYTNKKSYTAPEPFDINLNESVFIALDKSTSDPIELKFNEHVQTNQVLREPSKPIVIKDITVKLLDKIGNYYDLVDKTISLDILVEYD